jgi:hypothetical protein
MKGSCLCGAVRFEAEPAEHQCHACHCEMCRRWTGAAFVAVPVAPDAIRFDGGETIRVFRSSDWAERAFCGTCGSTLFYRVTADGAQRGMRFVALGLFDAPDGFPLTSELFIDVKPDGYAFAGEHKQATRAEFLAMFSQDASGDPA